MILDGTQFPVLWQGQRDETQELERLGCPRSVPWVLVAPHEKRARSNHSQSLTRLAERGGLSPAELLAVLEDRPFRFWQENGVAADSDVAAVPALLALLRAGGACPQCHGSGRVLPRVSGAKPADECRACKGLGRISREPNGR